MKHLHISCLKEHNQLLRQELDPLYVCDRLFEEGALTIPDHDKVTEAENRRKQMDCLLKTVEDNENDCFNVFLFILQNEKYHTVLSVMEKTVLKTRREGLSFLKNILFLKLAYPCLPIYCIPFFSDANNKFVCRLYHRIMKKPGNF